MARGDTISRQWRLLLKIASSRNGITALKLADDLECSKRTLYRDLIVLQKAGFPIYDDHNSTWHLLLTYNENMKLYRKIFENRFEPCKDCNSKKKECRL